MSRVLTQGVPAALAAGILYNLAPVIEAVASRGGPMGSGMGLRLLVTLVRRPLWLAGFGCELAAYGVQVFALTTAPLVLVEPLIASGLVVLVVTGGRLLHEKVTRAGLVGIALVMAGVVTLTLSFGHQGDTGTLASSASLWLLSAGCGAGTAAFVSLALTLERRRSYFLCGIAFGGAAGSCFGVTGLTTRQLSLLVSDYGSSAPLQVLRSPTPYLLIVFGILAQAVIQRGYQRANPTAVVPVMTALGTCISVLGGVIVFGEGLPGSTVAFSAAVAGFLAVAVGVMGFVRQPSLNLLARENPDEPRREEAAAAPVDIVAR